MNYNQAEQFILSLSNLPRKEYMKEAHECKIYLKRMQFFLDILGNPEKKIPHYIHVTGTSGKGSVCAYIYSILKKANKKTGMITSPHPTYITERWETNGKIISKKDFTNLIEEIKPKIDKYTQTSPYDMISYAELMTAIGLYHLARKKVKWAVVEVGCGGRYDSTNIIPKKDAAIITNIGIDHTKIIGPTKADIAYEKAGIIKPGCKVFTSEKNKNILDILEKECEKNKTELQKIKTKTAKIEKTDLDGTIFIYKGDKFKINNPGKHQITNAILAIEVMRGLEFSEKNIKKGLKNVTQPLRVEIISKKPLIILDGAHNFDKVKSTVETVKDNKKKRKVHLLVGFSGDKEWKKMIKLFSTLKPNTVACTRNTVNPFRKVTHPKEIAQEFTRLLPNIKSKVFADPSTALQWSRKQLGKDDILLITGSIFLSGELRPELIG